MDTPLAHVDDHRDLVPVQLDMDMEQQVSPSRTFTLLWRSKRLILGIMLFGSLIGGAVIFSLPHYYDAQSLVMIDTRKTEFNDLQAVAGAVTADALTVRTQTDILASPAIAGRVADRLDIIHTAEVQKLITARPALPHRALAKLSGWLGVPPAPARSLTLAEQRQMAMSWLSGRMTIANDGRSYAVSITARTPDPALSAGIANAYADSYLEFMKGLKIQALTRANTWLDKQISPLQERVRQTEEAVEKYREQNGLVLNRTMDTDNGPSQGQAQGMTVADQQLNQVNSQLITARGDLAEKLSNLRQAQAAMAGGRGLEAVPQVLASPLIQQLREQQAQLAQRSASLEQTALGENPALQSVRASSADLNRRIGAEIGKMLTSLQAQAAAAQAHVDVLEQSLARLQGAVVDEKKAEVTLRQLTSEAEAARAVYRDYLGRYEQTSSQEALQEPEADLISRAESPLAPSGPPRGRLMALAVIGSAMLGALTAVVRDRQHGGLRTAEQMERETGLFPLGFLPLARRGDRRAIEQEETLYTGSVDHVRSLLRFGDRRYRAQVALVTSAAAEEGKSFFSLSLAASVGRGGGKALVIDMDVRRSAFAELTGKLGTMALVPVTKPNTRQLAYINDQVLPGVTIMRLAGADSGYMPPGWAADLGQLIEDARGQYDMIVIDTPPVLALPDAAIMSSLVDGAILAVRWRKTPASAVTSALRTLNAYGVRLLGGVLTQVQFDDLGAGEGAHAHVYHKTARYFSA